MPRLRLPRRMQDERGASAVLVALLMIPLLGFGALAVDGAAMYAEHQQLQNGADAAALAIGLDCAAGDCGDWQTTAGWYAGENHEDIGSTRGTPVVTFGDHEVTVTNPGVKDHWLAPAIGIETSDLDASATVRWGGPQSGPAMLPLAFSWCEFAKQTGGGLPVDPPATTTIYLTKSSPAIEGTPDCTGPSNNVVPGGFGWLDPDPGVCRVTSEAGGIVHSSPGNSVPNSQECTPEYVASLIGQTVLLPIFEEFGGTGNNAWYRVHGYAAFTLTGYYFAGRYKGDPPAPCSGNERCIRGSFVQYVDSTGEFTYGPTAPDLGGRVVSLVA